jgi:FMN phosphatase YigB (HAD superfamily)
MLNPNAVIFDLGGVLIDVDSRYLYRQMSNEEARIEHYLDQTCTPAWHFEQDRGRSIIKATEVTSWMLSATRGLDSRLLWQTRKNLQGCNYGDG